MSDTRYHSNHDSGACSLSERPRTTPPDLTSFHEACDTGCALAAPPRDGGWPAPTGSWLWVSVPARSGGQTAWGGDHVFPPRLRCLLRELLHGSTYWGSADEGPRGCWSGTARSCSPPCAPPPPPCPDSTFAPLLRSLGCDGGRCPDAPSSSRGHGKVPEEAQARGLTEGCGLWLHGLGDGPGKGVCPGAGPVRKPAIQHLGLC